MPELSQSLQRLIQTFMQQSMRRVIVYAKERGLSMSQMGTLLFLHRHETCAVSDIGDYLGITSAASSQLLNRLVEEGLVERNEDPEDRRHKLLELTPAGRKTVKEAIELRHSWLVGLAEALSSTEQNQVGEAINLLLAKVGQMETDDVPEGTRS
jgi:DNA-binding MarR family transcriptional regulator